MKFTLKKGGELMSLNKANLYGVEYKILSLSLSYKGYKVTLTICLRMLKIYTTP